VTENSEIPYMDAFFTENALDPEMKQFVKTANVGDFSTCFVVVFFARTDIDSDIFDYFSFFLLEQLLMK